MRALINPALDTAAVPAPRDDADAFHRALPGYGPTPVYRLAGRAKRRTGRPRCRKPSGWLVNPFGVRVRCERVKEGLPMRRPT